MSALSDFIKGAFPQARAVIGAETIAIGGGSSLSCVAGEESFSRDLEVGGFGETATLEVVVLTTDFEASYASAPKSYLGKTATCKGKTWRIRDIGTDSSRFTTSFNLIAITEGA